MSRLGGFGLNYDTGFSSGPVGGGGGGYGGYDPSLFTGNVNREFTAGQNQQDRNLQARLNQMNQAGENYRAQLGVNASLIPQQLRQQRFNQVFPLLGQGIGNFGYGQQPTGTAPRIDAGPVYSADQTQQQVNASRAQNDAATQSQITQSQRELAGRGFAPGGPLEQALKAQYQGQNLQTNTGAEQQLRFNSAQANAQQRLQGQSAQEQQFASRQQEQIDRQRTAASQQNALWAALAGLV